MESFELALLGLAIVFFSTWCFNWFIHMLAIIYGKWKLHRSYTNLVTEDLPGISILKPLVGIDPNLFENLETFFTMKYTNVFGINDYLRNIRSIWKTKLPFDYELLFCIHDEMDASRMIVQSLIDKYPNVDAKMFLGGKNIGINPKINNMALGYEAAKYDLIMISDSGIRMKEDTLIDMALTMTDKVGLVHQMPYVCTRKGFAASAEKVYFGSQHAKMYLCADIFRINCATGMSSLMRKSVMDEAGGMKEFGQYLAEDYFIAQAFLDRGWRVRCSSHLAQQNSGTYSLSHHHSRLCRWMKLRNAMVPSTSLVEPISLCMTLGVATSWAVNYMFDISPMSFMLVHILFWFLLDYTMMKVLEITNNNDVLPLLQNTLDNTKGSVPLSKFDYVVCWFLNEFMYIFLILQSHWDPKITWRGRAFKLKWGGIVEEMFTKQTV